MAIVREPSANNKGGGKSVNNINEQRTRITNTINRAISVARANGQTQRERELRARQRRVNATATRYVANIRRNSAYQQEVRQQTKNANQAVRDAQRGAVATRAQRQATAQRRVRAAEDRARIAQTRSYARSTYQNNSRNPQVRYAREQVGRTNYGSRAGIGQYRNDADNAYGLRNLLGGGRMNYTSNARSRARRANLLSARRRMRSAVRSARG